MRYGTLWLKKAAQRSKLSWTVKWSEAMEFSSCLGRLFHHSRRKLWAATIKWNFDFFFQKIHRRRRSHFIFSPKVGSHSSSSLVLVTKVLSRWPRSRLSFAFDRLEQQRSDRDSLEKGQQRFGGMSANHKRKKERKEEKRIIWRNRLRVGQTKHLRY